MITLRNTIVFGIVVFWLLLGGIAIADEEGHAEQSIEESLKRIRSELGIRSEERIDPEAVSSELLEELGDAVMAEMALSETHHQWMDVMMGGEGSESLASAHRWMGYRYLTGGYGGPFGPRASGEPGWGSGRGSMHGGMMGPGMMGRYGLMGNRQWGSETERYDSPEDIARRRYAAGEITREEFRRIMEDLER